MFPTVKLNPFKKIEIYSALREQDRKFDAQLEAYCNGTNNDVLPTWEVEKKILFWTYIGHKHLYSSITSGRFEKPLERSHSLLTQDELDAVSKTKQYDRGSVTTRFFLDNLRQRELLDAVAESEYRTNPDTHKYAEVIWHYYTPQVLEKSDQYAKEYGAKVKLKAESLPLLSYCLQIISLYAFYIIAAFVLTFQIIDLIGLLDDMKFPLNTRIKVIMGYALLVAPVAFTIGTMSHLFHSRNLNKKFAKVETVKKKLNSSSSYESH